MIERTLIDVLKFKSKSLASRWKTLIRKAPQLRHYNALSDDELIHINEPLYKQLARYIERGLDRSVLGEFFVSIGKNRQGKNCPISETVFACNLNQKTVIDYMMSEFTMDNTAALYETIGLINKVNEFFFLGCFYMIKGFLEKTYTNMSSKHKIADDLLKTYFNDDFFFKPESEEE